MYIYILYYIIYTLGLYTTGMHIQVGLGQLCLDRSKKSSITSTVASGATPKKRIDHQISGLSHSL